MTVLRPVFDNLGPQRRPLVVDSLCSGTETEAYVVQACGLIAAHHRLTVDNKENLDKWFAGQRAARSDCHFTCLRTLASSHAAHCTNHGYSHGIPEGRADLLSTGFVCKPYSDLRVGRFSDGNVAQHRDSDMFEHVLAYIGSTRPRAVFLENVAGWNKRTREEREEGTPSAMEKAALSLRGLGYFARALSLDTDCWSQVHRPRVYIIAVSRDTASSDAALDTAIDLVHTIVSERGMRPPRDVHWLARVGPKAWKQDRSLARQALSSRAISESDR